jgi:hypothetical protein
VTGLGNRVVIIGPAPQYSERLVGGEVMVAQFTELMSAIKIRGRLDIVSDLSLAESRG